MGARYNRNNSGWFDLAMFEAWFEEILLPFMRKLNGPKIILGDLSSHISFKSFLKIRYKVCSSSSKLDALVSTARCCVFSSSQVSMEEGSGRVEEEEEQGSGAEV